jgi:hypothetical protein
MRIVDASVAIRKFGLALQQGGGFNVKRYVPRTLRTGRLVWRYRGKSVLDS